MNPLTQKIDALLERYEEAIIAHRRWFHAHPELSGQEKESAAYIAAELRKLGLEPTENVGGYGVTAVIQGKAPGKCIGLRADFDALPIQEATGLPFASQNPGVMHACGHDAHPAVLLGAAMVLMELRDQFSGSVKLVFQPSEENSADSGAKKMIADGALENPRVDAMIGQHIVPGDPVGSISMKDGVCSAASDRFFISIQGKNAHASTPQAGVDAIVIGAQIITALQTIVSRNVSPLDSAVLTIGKVVGGDRYNVLGGYLEMEGTCRNLNPEVRNAMPGRMENIIKGIAEGMGASYTFNYIMGYSSNVNDHDMFELARQTSAELLGTENVIIQEESGLGGEDFCFFAEKVPTIYLQTGFRREDVPVFPLHNGKMNLNEAGLKVAARVMLNTALNYLAQE